MRTAVILLSAVFATASFSNVAEAAKFAVIRSYPDSTNCSGSVTPQQIIARDGSCTNVYGAIAYKFNCQQMNYTLYNTADCSDQGVSADFSCSAHSGESSQYSCAEFSAS